MMQDWRSYRLILLVLAVLSFSVHGSSSDLSFRTVELTKENSIQLLGYSKYLKDAHGKLTWQKSLKSSGWLETKSNDLNLGITQSTYWFKFSIKFVEDQTQVFQIHYPLLDYVDFYLLDDETLIKHVATGDALPFDSRGIREKDFVLTYSGKKGSIVTLLIKVKTQGTMVLPISTSNINYYAQEESVENVAYGIYFGITFAMLIYNLMLFVYIKERSYLYYCLFVLSIFISAISYTGHGFYGLWPNHSNINSFMAPFTAAVSFLFSMLFFSSFLQVRTRGVWGERVFNIGIFLSCLVILASIFRSYSESIKIISIVQVILTTIVISYSISLWRKGIVEAKYFTLAWLSFIVGNAISAMRVVGVLPSNDFTVYANLYGNVIEMLMLSMGLAYRFETMREAQVSLSRELRLAQQEAIGNLIKFKDLFQKSPVGLFRYDRVNNQFFNNTKAIDLIGDSKDVNRFLHNNLSFSDYKKLLKYGSVKDRVIKLERDVYYNLSLLAVRNESGRVIEIEGTLSDVSSQKQAEVSRITNEKEKLNTLTQLVVGISHQFNTPLGVLVTTEDMVKKNLIDIVQDIETGKLKKNELLQTLNMIQDAMELSSQNTKVMATILKDLRCSISTRKDLNISCIDFDCFFSDLLGFYKAQLKERSLSCCFEVKVELNDILRIYCDYDVISDVFLRLYENSNSHAYLNGLSTGSVSIQLFESDEFIIIEYFDDGRGLDKTEKDNIFVPFFTGNTRSKDNSGLGMFILHNQVVKILQGKVDLLSPSSGFGIRIEIPKQYPDTVQF